MYSFIPFRNTRSRVPNWWNFTCFILFVSFQSFHAFVLHDGLDTDGSVCLCLIVFFLFILLNLYLTNHICCCSLFSFFKLSFLFYQITPPDDETELLTTNQETGFKSFTFMRYERQSIQIKCDVGYRLSLILRYIYVACVVLFFS